MTTLHFSEHLRELVSDKDVILSDIWGVIHNGLVAFPEACDALQTFRAGGGTVILITNAPRPADSVQRQLRKLGVADEAYDDIVSSGDLTRNYVTSHIGKSMYWIGPDRDNSIYRGLDASFAPLEQADFIVCTGPFDDETESAEDYRDTLIEALSRKLTLVCANPDIVVERGERLIYCAGAIAELYREMGGDVIFYGKPHRPIYDQAIALATRQCAAAEARAGDRRFRADRPCGRDRLWHRPAVRHPRHSFRRIRRHRPARRRRGQGAVRPSAESADARAALVTAPALLSSSGERAFSRDRGIQ